MRLWQPWLSLVIGLAVLRATLKIHPTGQAGIKLLGVMIAGVHYRFANHHYHPSTVANEYYVTILVSKTEN